MYVEGIDQRKVGRYLYKSKMLHFTSETFYIFIYIFMQFQVLFFLSLLIKIFTNQMYNGIII